MESLEEYPLVDSESKEKGGRNARKLRIFDEKMRNLCWQKADVVPGRHPERWRKDIAGNVVCRSLTRCKGCLCYEYDHIQPYSKGLSLISLPVIETQRGFLGLSRMNFGWSADSLFLKIPIQLLPDFTCLAETRSKTQNPSCTRKNHRDRLAILVGIGASILEDLFADKFHLIWNLAAIWKVGETDVSNCQILQSRVNRLKSDKDDLGKQDLQQLSCNIKFGEKELDLIEMAVYGNVERPGLQCRCKSVAESLGTSLSKAKGPQMSCELPYKSTS